MSRKVEVGKKILIANEEYALKNSKFFGEQKKLCLNMISSPGSGKTTILAKTIMELQGKLKIGVIEGDIQTSLDAERIRETKAPAVQIETGGSCHLSASQVSDALDKLETNELDLIFIENVGNLVCPSAFELGENGKVVVLSVAEGDDKPAKYPAIFAKSKVLLINKIDLMEAVGQVDFNIEKVKSDALNLNRNIEIFSISAKTGEGMQSWYEWLANSVSQTRGS